MSSAASSAGSGPTRSCTGCACGSGRGGRRRRGAVSDTLFSPSWYRVAALKPRVRAHAAIHRHAYRGQVWFVLQDHAAARSHRFSPAAHYFIGLMDGNRTVQEIWEAAAAQLGDGAPTQEEVIRLLGQLHSADALLCDVPPDSQEVFRRHQRHERMEWRRRLWTPLALRFPLWDPDRFLRSEERRVGKGCRSRWLPAR